MTQEVRSRKSGNRKQESTSKLPASGTEPKEAPTLKYGPLPKFNGQRIFSRVVIIIGVLIYVWYCSKGSKETPLAKYTLTYDARGHQVDCDKSYLDEIKQYSGCVPKKCGRFVSDRVVTDYEADVLLWLAKRGMSLAGSSGGATIMDLHSGALSYGENFINFYKTSKSDFITPTDLNVYKGVRQKIQLAIAEAFGLDSSKLYLTHPTFFSRLTSKEPQTVHDEYWHVHIDKHTYESFHYTSLLYLNDYSKDYQGGRFVFVDKRSNVTVEPRKARVSMFTSGAENPHFVERVTEGERFAITISFTCDQSKKIADPNGNNNS